MIWCDQVRPRPQMEPRRSHFPKKRKYEPTAAELKAKAKAEGDQANFFLRAAAYDEAILWLAKTYIERENWTSADYQFRRLEGDDILPPRVYEELAGSQSILSS